jgi:hypothetical protein
MDEEDIVPFNRAVGGGAPIITAASSPWSKVRFFSWFVVPISWWWASLLLASCLLGCYDSPFVVCRLAGTRDNRSPLADQPLIKC